MADAPRPGHARKRAKRTGFRVTIGAQVWELNTADIGPGDDYLVRRQTGTPLSVFLTGDSFGLDSIAVIVWTARRKAGEKRLNLQRVFDELPSFAEFDELSNNDEFVFERLEEIDDEPDVLDVVSEEVLPDPLRSAGT